MSVSDKKTEQYFALFLILAGMGIRLLPHPANFTPVTALALFSGTVLSPGPALVVPFLAMMASDLFLQPHSLFWLVWGSFLATVWIGMGIRQNPKATTVVLGTFAGSLLFFVLTNLGVFLFQNMYPKNFQGLVDCYVMALPFWRNSLLGDLFYTAVFFGIFYFIRHSRESGNHIKV